MRPLISDILNKKLDSILALCFTGNRIADRGMSVLATSFVMNNTEKILHPKLAHLYPMLADKVSEYQASRNNMTVYGVTPEDGWLYESPLEFFDRMVNYQMDLETSIYEGILLAQSESDMSTVAFLYRFLKQVNKVTEQCLLLADKAEKYNGDWQAFDYRVETFIIL